MKILDQEQEDILDKLTVVAGGGENLSRVIRHVRFFTGKNVPMGLVLNTIQIMMDRNWSGMLPSESEIRNYQSRK